MIYGAYYDESDEARVFLSPDTQRPTIGGFTWIGNGRTYLSSGISRISKLPSVKMRWASLLNIETILETINRNLSRMSESG